MTRAEEIGDDVTERAALAEVLGLTCASPRDGAHHCDPSRHEPQADRVIELLAERGFRVIPEADFERLLVGWAESVAR